MQSHRSFFFLFYPLLWLLFCDWGGKLHSEADLLWTVTNWSPHELKKKLKGLQYRISEDVLKEHVLFWMTVKIFDKSLKNV